MPVAKGHDSSRRERLQRPVRMLRAVLPFNCLGRACV